MFYTHRVIRRCTTARLALIAVAACTACAQRPEAPDARYDLPDVATHDGAIDGPALARDHTGQIRLAAGAAAFGHSTATANFEDPVAVDTCSTLDQAPCRVVRCAYDATTDAGVAVPAIPRSAGSVTISGGAMAEVQLLPQGAGIYTTFDYTGDYWRPGDTLSIHTSGGDVPALATVVTFPSNTEVTDPIAGTWDRVPIDRTAGFTSHWNSPIGAVAILLAQVIDRSSTPGANDRELRVTARCVFQGSSGVGTIPAAALALFDPSPNLPRVDTVLTIVGLANTTVSAGNYTITVEADNGGIGTSASVR